MEFRKDNYINIQGWMITDLGLTGNNLIVFAIIYGFSQDGSSVFSGGYKYLAKATNTTKRSMINAVSRLVDDGLIIKIEKEEEDGKTCDFNELKWSGIKKQKSIDEVEEVEIYVDEGGVKTSPGVVKKVHQGSEIISPPVRKEKERSKEKEKIYIINNNIYTPLPLKGGEAHTEIEDRFAEFWNAYPRKVNKPQAFKSFKRLIPTAELIETIVRDIERRKKSKEWQDSCGQFIPHPSTYLNGRRWEDEEPVIQSNTMQIYEDDEVLTW